MSKQAEAFRPPGVDFEGWWLVDAIDGRRWIGRLSIDWARGVESYYGPTLQDDELVLQPAFEVPPDRAILTGYIVGEQLVQGHPLGAPQKMLVAQPQPAAISLFQIAPLFAEKNGLPPQRVRYAGLSRIADWSEQGRESLLRAVRQVLTVATPDEKPEVVWPKGEKVQ